MDEKESGPQRLQQALRAALEMAAHERELRVTQQKALESALAALDERLGTEFGGVDFEVEAAPGQCLVVAHTSDPVALDVVACFLHHGGASKLGSAKVWLLPLEELPVTRWARALRKVVAATRPRERDVRTALPVRLTLVWSQDGEMMVATLG